MSQPRAASLAPAGVVPQRGARAAGVVPGPTRPKRFHGTVTLDLTRVSRDASRIADEVISHLASLVGAQA